MFSVMIKFFPEMPVNVNLPFESEKPDLVFNQFVINNLTEFIPILPISETSSGGIVIF